MAGYMPRKASEENNLNMIFFMISYYLSVLFLFLFWCISFSVMSSLPLAVFFVCEVICLKQRRSYEFPLSCNVQKSVYCVSGS